MTLVRNSGILRVMPWSLRVEGRAGACFVVLLGAAACAGTGELDAEPSPPPVFARADETADPGDAPEVSFHGAPGARDAQFSAPDAQIHAPDTQAPAPLPSGSPDAAPSPLPPVDAAVPDAAAPEPPAPAALTIAIISDLNGSYGDPTYEPPVHAAVRRILDVRPDLVLCAGDMVAGQQAGLDYRAMWRGFHAAVTEPLTAAGIPLAVSPGNHDASGYPGFEEERRIYGDEWAARRPAVDFRNDADYPFRYSFSLGGAAFIALDDTLVGRLPAGQRAWVADRLAESADATARVVFGHVPIRGFTQGREDEVLGDDALEDLFVERGVTLFVAGHHHGYFPGRHRGLRQLSMACLGSGPRALIGTAGATPRGLVFLRLEDGRIAELEGYTGSDMTTRIERSSLPERVGVVVRDDL